MADSLRLRLTIALSALFTLLTGIQLYAGLTVHISEAPLQTQALIIFFAVFTLILVVLAILPRLPLPVQSFFASIDAHPDFRWGLFIGLALLLIGCAAAYLLTYHSLKILLLWLFCQSLLAQDILLRRCSQFGSELEWLRQEPPGDFSQFVRSENGERPGNIFLMINRLRVTRFGQVVRSLSVDQRLMIVIVVSSAVGLIMGLLSPQLQVGVEQGQVLSHLVSYSHDEPYYLFQAKLWNVWAQLSALGFSLGLSEISLSVAFSGLAGLISCLGLALIVFGITENTFLSIVTSIYILGFNHAAVFDGFAYPVMTLGWILTYGVLGLVFMALNLGLFAVRKEKWGFLLLGFMPVIHPSLALWLHFGILVYVLLDWKNLWQWIRRGLFVLPGYAISAASYIWQITNFPVKPLDTASVQRYLPTIITQYDVHTAYVIRPDNIPSNVFVCALVFAFFFLIRNKPTGGLKFLLQMWLVFAVAGIGFFIYSVSPLPFADTIAIFLPARVLNIVLYTIPPIMVGILWTCVDEIEYGLAIVGIFVFLLASFAARAEIVAIGILMTLILAFRGDGVRGKALRAVLVILWIIILLAFRDGYLALGLMADPPLLSVAILALIILFVAWGQFGGTSISGGLAGGSARSSVILVSLLVASISVLGRLAADFPQQARVLSYQSNPVVAAARQGHGDLLFAGDGMYDEVAMFQLRTRRPVEFDPSAMNLLRYTVEAGPPMAHLLDAVYGIDFFHPPDNMHIIPRIPATRKLWESRSPQEWRQLSAEFGFMQIITPTEWELQLPRLADDGKLALYDIPQ